MVRRVEDYANYLNDDIMIRECFLERNLRMLRLVVFKLTDLQSQSSLHSLGSPGIVIGKKGEDIETLRRD